MGRGALLAALALLAATFAAGPAAAQDKPVLSLVTGRAVSSLHVPGLVDDPSCGVCLNPLTFGSFDNATTLSGPPVDAKFGALFRVHLPVRQPVPMLMAVAHLEGGQLQVVAYERGDTACLDKELLDQFDWHPAGPGIIEKSGGVCASLTALAALPWQDPAYSRPPVQVVSARDFMRRYSLVVGEWGSSTSAPDEAACDGMMADEVCMDVIEDVRLREMLTLSGPRVSSQVPLRLTLHVPPRRGRKLVLLVAPAVKGQPRRATWVTTARTGSSACIERSWFKDNRLVEPIDSRQDGDRICFRV